MPHRNPAHIRPWRKHRGLTLRQLAARINTGRPAPLISYASLGRMESGLQPYSQDVLEAIAEALGVEPALLLSSDPGESEELAKLWPALTPRQRRLAIAIIQAIILCS